MRYKGIHTKETRVFKSQMRFDFEKFAEQFCLYLEEQVKLADSTLGISVEDERREFLKFVQERNEIVKKVEGKSQTYTYFDYFLYKYPKSPDNVGFNIGRMWSLQIMSAIQAYETAQIIRAHIRRIAEAREQEKGKGIYISSAGRPYLHDDPAIDDAIKADRELTAEAKKDYDTNS